MDCDNCVWAVLEGGGAEAWVLVVLAGHKGGEHTHGRIERGANLSNTVVATVVKVVQLILKGEDVQVTIQKTVGTCHEGMKMQGNILLTIMLQQKRQGRELYVKES